MPIKVNSGRAPLNGIRRVVGNSMDVAGSTRRGLGKKVSKYYRKYSPTVVSLLGKVSESRWIRPTAKDNARAAAPNVTGDRRCGRCLIAFGK